jgi:2-methylisocitrate lyase-like PEP mutase family enzyme
MPHVRPSIADKRRAFHKLHESGCFVIPNPWDVGSARYLQSVGFKALATTSSGFAWSHGHRDGGMSRDRVLDHLTDLVEATDLPINADFENGFAPNAAGVAESVRLAVETGVAGISIEDSTGDTVNPLFDTDVAIERIRAARQAIDKAGSDTLLVGRAECFLHGKPDLEFVTPEQITAVVAAVAPKPVNLLVGFADLTQAQIASLGVRRISVGGALARAAWGGFMRATKLIAEQGRFDGLSDGASGKALNTIFRGS